MDWKHLLKKLAKKAVPYVIAAASEYATEKLSKKANNRPASK